MSKLRVGVIMGGKSIEHEVSFNSGRTVCDHLDTARYTIIPLFQKTTGELFILPWHFLHRGKTSDFVHRLSSEAQSIEWDDLKDIIDFMFISMHGQFAEDGTLQGILELFSIPYLGSKILASALCMDKIIQKKIMHAAGIDVPRGIVLNPERIKTLKKNAQEFEHIARQLEREALDYPLIVKPSREGSSLGISVVQKAEQLPQALIDACHIAHKPQAVLVEEKIEGMEFSCISLVDYKTNKALALPPTEVVPENDTHFFNYEQKYMPGRAAKHTPARCSQTAINAIQATCTQVAKLLDIRTISRIDGFLTKDGRVIIVDPNTLSGMGPASFLFREAAELDMSHTHVINHLIETELHAYGMLEAIEKQERNTIMTQTKLRIAVLLGGRSNEREISLESGRNIHYKLSTQQYDTTPIYVSQELKLYPIGPKLLIRNSTKEIEALTAKENSLKWADLPTIADFVFIGLHGGEGENGSIQGTLEMLGLPYNGSGVLTSALCMDKFKTGNYLRNNGFDVPQAELVSKADFFADPNALVERITNNMPLPMIIKPHDDGCSVMVQKARTQKELHKALAHIFTHEKTYALVEECITGMELTVGCIGNEQPRALPPSQAVCTSDILSIEEKFLPGAGENQTPAPLPTQALQFVQQQIEAIYGTLQCKGYARIDCFYQAAHESPTGAQRVIFIEANTLPGMTPATCLFHQAAEIGMKPTQFIDTIVQLGLQEHAPEAMPQKAAPQEAPDAD